MVLLYIILLYALACIRGSHHYTVLMNIITPAMSPRQPSVPLPAVLPNDLVADILSLLAVKSLTRLRSVSKSWNALISVTWRNIQSFPMIPLHYNTGNENEGVYMNGTINWLALHNFRLNYDCKDITIDQFEILSLDLSTETYTELLLPRGFNEVPDVAPTIGVLMDCLCLYHDFRQTDFVIWQMKEFGVQESWTQLLKFSYLQDLQMDYDIHCVWDCPFIKLWPLCLPKNGDTLILGRRARIGYEAIIYNWRDNNVERIGITNQILWYCSMHYTESLVSIC